MCLRVFYGVHRGHRFLIDKARESAMQCGGPSVVLTSSIDADELFAAERLIKLMTNEERINALASSDVDIVAVLPFDRDFASLMPDEFLESAFESAHPPRICTLEKGSASDRAGQATSQR